MVIKVGINGFGRIGRIMFRCCFKNSNVEVTAINDPAIDVEYICYLIKFDSTHGNFNEDVMPFNNDIKINDNVIKVFREKQPSAVPWGLAGVQYVIESSGMFTNYEKAMGHLAGDGVKRVVVTAPSADVPMVIMGVNDDKLLPEHKVISSASSTLYCLAPIIKVLEKVYGVSDGFVTSIHAMTPSLKPLDGLCLRGKHWRDYRSIHQNIIPATTGACKALGKIIPQLKDKLVGLAFRVPIVNVSVLDLTLRLNKEASLDKIVESVENASKTYLKGILDVSHEENVSSDFIRDSHSCILDKSSSIELKPDFFKLICWYENEYSYACRVIDTILYSERQLYQARIAELRNIDKFATKKHLRPHSPARFRQFMDFDNCSTGTLPNMLKNYSKLFDFKVKPQCKPIQKHVPSTQVSVMNQTTTSFNTTTESKCGVYKIVDYDSISEKTVDNKNEIKVTKSGQKQKAYERLVTVKKELNKMMNMTEKLLKKSNKLTETCKCQMDNVKLKKGKECDAKQLHCNKKTKDALITEPCPLQSNNNQDILIEIPFPIHLYKKAILSEEPCDKNFSKNDQIPLIGVPCPTQQNQNENNVITEKCSPKKCDTPNKEASVKEQCSIQTEECCATKSETNNMCSSKNESITIQSSPTNRNNSGKEGEDVECNIDNDSSTVPTENIDDQVDNAMECFCKDCFDCSEANKTEDDTETMDCKAKENICHFGLHDNVTAKTLDSTDDDSGSKTETFDDNSDNAKCTRKFDRKHLPDETLQVEFDPCKRKKDVNLNNEHEPVMAKKDEEPQIQDDNLIKVGNIALSKNDKGIHKRSTNIVEYTTKYIIAGNNEDIKTEKGESKILRLRHIDRLNTLEQKKQSGKYITLHSCHKNTNTSIRTDLNATVEDIYDKLDSASATNSENSFDVNEKRSQIIHINDITNSLEDLGRLENICKIIEISDDLSNELFAKLQADKSDEFKNKQLSFKDFCEKINLDEFCKKIFRESRM